MGCQHLPSASLEACRRSRADQRVLAARQRRRVVRLAKQLGPDLPERLRDLHRHERIHDCDVLHLQAVPGVAEQEG